MKNKIFFLFIGIILISFQSCDRTITENIRSYVINYANYDSLYLDISSSENIRLSWAKQISVVDWNSKGRLKIVYDSLCEKRNDMNYYKKISYIGYPFERHYYMGNISNIDIISNVDFNSSHPAGSKLNDLVRFISVSPYKFIQSGYKETYNWVDKTPTSFEQETGITSMLTNYPEIMKYHSPIDKLLSEVTPSDMILIGDGLGGHFIGYLIFESSPEINKTHKCTITIKNTEGKLFTKSISKTFK